MSDYLIDLAQNGPARKIIKKLGLPVPLPVKLRRATGAWQAKPLLGHSIAVGGTGELSERVRTTAQEAGAEISEAGTHAVVFDATALVKPEMLRELYNFFQPRMGTLDRNCRALVLARPPQPEDALQAATSQALEGFVRSLAKELGKKGGTAQLVRVEKGAEPRAAAVLRFLLSERSAFISGQVVDCHKRVKGRVENKWVQPLAGKVALVTGAARGIGKKTAELLAQEGAHVVCLDRPADAQLLQETATAIGGSVLLADVTDAGAPQQIAAHLKEHHGHVDIVVHNAGITRDKTLGKMSAEQWDQVLGVNLKAITEITPALLDGVLSQDGRIICMASTAGIAGNFGQTNYASSKAGVIGYVRALSTTLAPLGITVNAIAPGFIETRLTDEMPVMVRETARRLSALSQGGQPQDVAETITFLASPDALGVSGSVIRVCGLLAAGA